MGLARLAKLMAYSTHSSIYLSKCAYSVQLTYMIYTYCSSYALVRMRKLGIR